VGRSPSSARVPQDPLFEALLSPTRPAAGNEGLAKFGKSHRNYKTCIKFAAQGVRFRLRKAGQGARRRTGVPPHYKQSCLTFFPGCSNTSSAGCVRPPSTASQPWRFHWGAARHPRRCSILQNSLLRLRSEPAPSPAVLSPARCPAPCADCRRRVLPLRLTLPSEPCRHRFRHRRKRPAGPTADPR
jgi:hypothetical protein